MRQNGEKPSKHTTFEPLLTFMLSFCTVWRSAAIAHRRSSSVISVAVPLSIAPHLHARRLWTFYFGVCFSVVFAMFFFLHFHSTLKFSLHSHLVPRWVRVSVWMSLERLFPFEHDLFRLKDHTVQLLSSRFLFSSSAVSSSAYHVMHMLLVCK